MAFRLAERGITVIRQSIRVWSNKFEALYARTLKRQHRGYGDIFYIDEIFVKISGKQHGLWRAVDQDGQWLVCIFMLSEMAQLQRVSSGACSGHISVSP